MDPDLQDLLALWLGDVDPGEGRRDALLARLHSDDAFRRAFVEELRLLGMLKAVQSPEPRWLRLEDEVGWSARQRAGDEALAQRALQEWERRRRARRRLGRALAAAAAVLVAAGLYLAFRPGPAPDVRPEPPPAASGSGAQIATLIQLDGVQWETEEAEPLREGSVVALGRLRLRQGRLTLVFFNGASLTVEGPADLELLAADRVYCHRGRLRARVPRGAEGFTVLAPGVEVLDLGTEFALNLGPEGKSRVMVFEGEAAVSVLGQDGRSVRGALLDKRRSVEIDPSAGQIQDVPPQPEAFVPLPKFVPAPLDLAPDYAAEVLAAKPWGYWRFDAREGRVPNQVAGRPALKVLGGVRLEKAPGGNHWARFRPDRHAQALLVDGDWAPPRAAGYALEVWVQADLPSPKAFGQTALIGLIDKEDGKTENHLAYLELTARGRRSPHEPCAVRFLDRWPASTSGGADVFSRRTLVPSLWHHVVGQKSGDTLELYIDGERVGTSPAKGTEDPATAACRLLVGRLKRRSHPPFTSEVRAFEGRLAELAVYDRPLTAEEVRRHAQLRAAGVARAAPADPAPQPAVDFARDVQPILARSCVGCHGPQKQRGGLRLDTAAGLRQGGDSGPPVVPGNSSKSRLYRAIAGTEGKVMPPKGPRLAAAEVGRIKAWIDQGAKLPAEEKVGAVGPKVAHWSFQPVKRPPVPSPRKGRIHNPIDAFILARLEKEGLSPSPEADRTALLRRLALDLTGLPPTLEEVDAFVKDRRPDAYERQVDRLLASPHYGERWGRHWLDLARYADSNGYSIDSPRTIWPYRDWVIGALNADLPFDRFTVEQLAGDLLPGATLGQKVATGFHRNTQINEEGGIDPEQFRVEAVIDRVNTTGAVWMGLTVGCCQCHSHKYDPITQREYYQLFAFFNNQDEPKLPLGVPDPSAPPRRKGKPRELTTLVLQEREAPRETHVLMGGDFTHPGAKVGPGTPAVLPPLGKQPGGAPNRLDLARWLVRPDHPLTARVCVNRVWGQYFGLGLVETENDFGTRGTSPSHPELLDWLADELVRQGWSLKALHRLIVTSATYRQSSQVRRDLETADPRNRLLARQARLRLEAEVVRDVALAASGLLERHVGGPSVFPPQPEGVSQFTQVKRAWRPNEGRERYRRGMYTHFWRSAPHPALLTFDAPDAGTACTRRNRSNTPLQALTLLNDAGFAEYAYGLAARSLCEGQVAEADQVRHGFRLCLGREPSEAEAKRLTAFLAKQRQHYAASPAEAQTLLGGGGPAGEQLAEAPGAPGPKAALVLLARVLLNLDECITRE
jgi:hypothetical protein